MIKLKNILREVAEALEFFRAWQKPDGTLIPVEYSHPSDAIKHLGEPRGDATVVLWKKGWNRITSGWTHHRDKAIYSHNEFMPPNDKQRAELINVAKEQGFTEIIYTSPDDGNPRTLWSKHDVVEDKI